MRSDDPAETPSTRNSHPLGITIRIHPNGPQGANGALGPHWPPPPLGSWVPWVPLGPFKLGPWVPKGSRFAGVVSASGDKATERKDTEGMHGSAGMRGRVKNHHKIILKSL